MSIHPAPAKQAPVQSMPKSRLAEILKVSNETSKMIQLGAYIQHLESQTQLQMVRHIYTEPTGEVEYLQELNKQISRDAENISFKNQIQQEEIVTLQEQVNNLTDELQKYKEENQRLQKPQAAYPSSFNQYAINAQKTESIVTSEMLIRLARMWPSLKTRLIDIVDLSVKLDAYKKFIFYGNSNGSINILPIPLKKDGTWDEDNEICRMFPYSEDTSSVEVTDQLEDFTRLLHGVLGLTTEAGELCLPIVDIPSSQSSDAIEKSLINLAEESGDSLWYLALIANALGETGLWNGSCSLQTIADTNLDKLRTRYPEKFTQEAATNRDLDAEQEVLSHKIDTEDDWD